jgi:hypothetical protein
MISNDLRASEATKFRSIFKEPQKIRCASLLMGESVSQQPERVWCEEGPQAMRVRSLPFWRKSSRDACLWLRGERGRFFANEAGMQQ